MDLFHLPSCPLFPVSVLDNAHSILFSVAALAAAHTAFNLLLKNVPYVPESPDLG
jgi:hypothetical protein